jgi:hypothetical protein
VLLWWLVLANFLGALSSSALLTKGMFAFGPGSDSILAFLVGSTLSLALILNFRKRIARVGPFMTLFSAAITLSLIWALQGDTTLAFALLCLQFSCSFVSRAFRSDLAAVRQGRLPWVELAHSLGYTLGLLGTQRLGNLGLGAVLPIAGGGYLLAGVLDFLAVGKLQPSEGKASGAPLVSPLTWPAGWATLLLVGLTLAVQIATQMLSKHFATTDPLAAFDVGTTLAPIAYGSLLFGLVSAGKALFWTELRSRKGAALPFGIGVILCLLLMAGGYFFTSQTEERLSGLLLLGGAAFLYEFLALSLLDWLGESFPGSGAVSVAYGLMALTGTLAYGAFLKFDWAFPQIGTLLLGCVGLCAVALLGRATVTDTGRASS